MQRVWYRRFAAKIQRRVCHLQLFRQPKVPVPMPVQENEKLFFRHEPQCTKGFAKKMHVLFFVTLFGGNVQPEKAPVWPRAHIRIYHRGFVQSCCQPSAFTDAFSCCALNFRAWLTVTLLMGVKL